MSEITTRVEYGIRKEPLQVETEEEPLLAAALAAALVEYRGYVGQANSHVEKDSSHTNWRIAGRLQQLRSPA
jgi:hypothetical protein